MQNRKSLAGQTYRGKIIIHVVRQTLLIYNAAESRPVQKVCPFHNMLALNAERINRILNSEIKYCCCMLQSSLVGVAERHRHGRRRNAAL